MNLKGRCGALALIGLGMLLTGGCGGGGASTGSASVADSTRGTLVLEFTFPPSRAASAKQKTRAFGGNIPVGSRAIQVTLTDPENGQTLAPQRLVTAPVTTSNTLPVQVTIQYPQLRPGPIRVSATVFPDTAAQEPPIATGTVSGQISALSTTSLTLNFALTLANLSVTPTTLNLSPLQGPTHTGTAAATVTNSAGQPLRYPLFWLANDPGIAQVTFDPANPNTVTVTGLAEGSTVVTVVEPNSGMTAAVNVTVRISD